MNLDSVKQTFVVESTELLDDMEAALLQLERDPENRDAVHAVFRAAHTIKGSSGMFGYKRIVEFTHVLESFLEELRQGKFSVNSDMIAVLLSSGDHIKDLISIYMESESPEISQAVIDVGEDLLTKLKAQAPQDSAVVEKKIPKVKEKAQIREKKTGKPVSNSFWHISLRFKSDVLKHGLDPLSFINYLGGLGSIENLYTVTDHVPDADNVDPEECYLGFEISLKSDASLEEIQNVFEFLEDEAYIVIIEPKADVHRYLEFIEKAPEGKDRIREILIGMKVVGNDELEPGFDETETETEEEEIQEETVMETVTETVPEETKVEEAPRPAVEAPKAPGGRPAEASSKTVSETTAKFIRIDAGKLDNLINLVGELVISVANIRQLSEEHANKNLIEASLTMGRLVEEVRDSAMNIRMVQIGDTFRRFERVVRDLSIKMGKEIDLHISGGDTELDKTVVEKITDPLMHLIRNAIDHGISTPEERIAGGKEPKGHIYVNAFHDTGSIVIEISDDGNGLDKTKILNKAVENQLVSHGVELSDQEIYQLIFEPGLSTAKVVTDVSGRGVGMDVVKKNIEALRGTVDVESEAGEGTTMRIHLPLTLAIIDGFLVEIGKSSFVIPLDMVLECITMDENDKLNAEGGNFVNLRGEVLPYLRMKEFFQEEGAGQVNENIIVVKYGQQKAGLVVDKLLGEFQTVIKPLGKIFKNVQGISGATILGNGLVAMILDIPRLIRFAQDLESSHKAENVHS